MVLFINNFLYVLPEIYIFLAINGLLVVGVYLSHSNSQETDSQLTLVIVNLVILLLSFTILLYINMLNISIIIFNYMYILTSLTLMFKLLICFVSVLILLLSRAYVKEEKLYSFEYSLLILLALFGMLLMVSSYDFLSMYLALELQSLSLYILAAYKRTTISSTEAGLKYFILGAFSSGLLLFGLTLLYGLTGTMSFDGINMLINNDFLNIEIFNYVFYVAVVFTISGLLFKISAAPFHVWTPDVYDGAPLIVVAFFALVAKTAALGLMIVVLYKVFINSFETMQNILWVSSVLSLIIGSLGALYQDKIKRLYAYSSITHVGFILIGLSTGTLDGLESVLFYIIVYIILGLLLFCVLLSIRNVKDGIKLVYLNDFTRILKGNPLMAILFTLNLFSIAGIPPLMGFYSKYYLLLSAMKSHFYFLALLAVIVSVISSVYYIRLIVIMFFDTKQISEFYFKKVPIEASLILSYCSLINVLFFLRPDGFLIWCHNLVLSFFL